MAEAPQVSQPPSHHPTTEFSESEYDDYIRPWSESTYSEKVRLIGYNLVIYCPVVFLVMILTGMPAFYFVVHFLPVVLTGNDRPELYYWHSSKEHFRSRVVGCACLGLEMFFLSMLVWSFYQAVRTPPGHVPDTPEWTDLQAAQQVYSHLFNEKKRGSGSIRWCRRCEVVKPDRSHHCRLCDFCVLKMDHHCPWIANCVGFFNYKYFFLMLFYGMLALWVFSGTFWETVLISLRDDEKGAGFAFFVTLVYFLMVILTFSITLFWCFHVYLLVNAITTIEFCEKRRNLHHMDEPLTYYESVYKSLQCGLGLKPIYWLLPFHYREKDESGLYFLRGAKS